MELGAPDGAEVVPLAGERGALDAGVLVGLGKSAAPRPLRKRALSRAVELAAVVSWDLVAVLVVRFGPAPLTECAVYGPAHESREPLNSRPFSAGAHLPDTHSHHNGNDDDEPRRERRAMLCGGG